VQVLALSRNRAAKRAVEVVQHDRLLELERANAKLRAELEQSRIKIAEMEERQSSLCSGHDKLKNEFDELHGFAKTL
jgi:uncharacterized membrane protein